jgi:hypothetical protein
MYVVKHIHGMDYLASRPGREFSTDSNVEYALKFGTREEAEAAESITPSLWTIEEI